MSATTFLRAHFERLSLRAKLALGFGLVIALMLLSSASALLGHWGSMRALDQFLDSDDRIAHLSENGLAQMEKARRFEKEFLIKRQVFSFEEAKARYATLVGNKVAKLHEDMAAIRLLSHSTEIDAKTRAIDGAVERYAGGFLHVVDLYGRLGRVDTGLEGVMRQRSHEIEALVMGRDVLALRVDLLTLRRYEKDFIARGQQLYVGAFAHAAQQFRTSLTHARLAPYHAQRLQHLLALYEDGFLDYVARVEEIDAASIEYLEAVHRIEPALEELRQNAESAKALTHVRIRTLNATIGEILVGGGIVALLLGLLAARFIVGNVNRAIGLCVQFARRLATGDWSARMAERAGGKEFGMLDLALNQMADDMLAAHQREAAGGDQLRQLNRTLRLLSRCNEALARARSEQEMLQTVCQHIVECGGYAMAWVGLARHDGACSISPVASAGPVGWVPQSDLSWAADPVPRGMCGHAIHSGRTVVTRDTGAEPMFEPCRALTGKYGIAASMALPLRDKQGVLGAITIYSVDPLAFDTAEMQLLQELADNLSFGIVGQREAEGRVEAEQALDYQLNHDPLTGLANRNLFNDRLRQSSRHALLDGRTVAVLLLTLDRFKTIKDSLGPDAANLLLSHVAGALSAALPDGATLARLSGEEFVLEMGNLECADDVMGHGARLLQAVQAPLAIAGGVARTSASIGISLYPKDGSDTDALLRCANAAMASAQAMGGDRLHFYAPEMNERSLKLFALESELQHGLDESELRVYYQPRVNLASGAVVGAEALLRWQHPQRGLVAPGDFIPLAESTGLIVPIGAWVLDEVVRQQRAWSDAGLPIVPVAVNVSPRQFRETDLASQIRDALERHGLDPSLLEVEITESTLMDDVDQALATLVSLKALGIKLSLDDFGTGHSSLSRLRHLPIDHLKIDQSFVRNLTRDPGDAAVCHAIIDLAHNLHMTVIAEGVETEGQANYLRSNRCDEMQGYYFARPMPGADFEEQLRQNHMLALPEAPVADLRTLLLVDDERNILSSLNRLFHREGYRILVADSASAGLELLATNEVQVILSDQRMPEMNGAEFLARVRDLYPHTIRMMLSGYTDLHSVTDAINRGSIYKFLTKPWDDDALRGEVRAAFRQFETEKLRA
ncbi:MAG: EAL domain-containing protein [Pseudomonadota bacterium]